MSKARVEPRMLAHLMGINLHNMHTSDNEKPQYMRILNN